MRNDRYVVMKWLCFFSTIFLYFAYLDRFALKSDHNNFNDYGDSLEMAVFMRKYNIMTNIFDSSLRCSLKYLLVFFFMIYLIGFLTIV